MITFILNETEIHTSAAPGTPLLDIIRKERNLKGTKLVCGEGECGACTVLVGSRTTDGVRYHSVTSCIAPIANIAGKHIVTIEGIHTEDTGPVHRAIVACNGTQCGFCTPGFVVSLTGGLLNHAKVNAGQLIAAMDGNICRCTGYKSIERAAEMLALQFADKAPTLDALIEAHVIPEYFRSIESRLRHLESSEGEIMNNAGVHIGGGTDLYVQKPDTMRTSLLHTTAAHDELFGISIKNNICIIGAGETMSTLQHSPVIQKIIPGIQKFLAPVGSTQIRNMATVGGNLANASPIGDLTIMFLGLDASIILLDGETQRSIKLRDFYLGYKKLNKTTTEIIFQVHFNIPIDGLKFHFERVCKRTYLDVASVNTACMLRHDDAGVVQEVHLSAGGVAAIPLYLQQTTNFLRGKSITTQDILEAAGIIQEEISPISDIRGSEEYKRLLLRQLFFMHMATLSPASIEVHELISA